MALVIPGNLWAGTQRNRVGKVGFPLAESSKNLDTTDRIECGQPGHLHQEPGSVDVLSAESAQEHSPGRKPWVGNSPLIADDSPDGASERFSLVRSPHPLAPSPRIGKGWRHDARSPLSIPGEGDRGVRRGISEADCSCVHGVYAPFQGAPSSGRLGSPDPGLTPRALFVWPFRP